MNKLHHSVDKLHKAGKMDNLQQANGVSGCLLSATYHDQTFQFY